MFSTVEVAVRELAAFIGLGIIASTREGLRLRDGSGVQAKLSRVSADSCSAAVRRPGGASPAPTKYKNRRVSQKARSSALRDGATRTSALSKGKAHAQKRAWASDGAKEKCRFLVAALLGMTVLLLGSRRAAQGEDTHMGRPILRTRREGWGTRKTKSERKSRRTSRTARSSALHLPRARGNIERAYAAAVCRRTTAARPSSPMPKRTRVPGSGVALDGASSKT